MTPDFLKLFFGWCTLFNGGLLVFITLLHLAVPGLMYRTQTKFFPMPQPTHGLVLYGFLGVFKIFFLVFNLVPWLVLTIIA